MQVPDPPAGPAWQAAATDLALDGQLMDEREEPVSLEKVLKDLQARGVPVTGEEVAEAELRAAWEATTGVVSLAVQPNRFEALEPVGDVLQLELFAA